MGLSPLLVMAEQPKRLTRPRDDQLIAGVLSGIACYYGHDPTVVRLVFVALLIITGLLPGIIFYAAAWIIMPEA